MLNQLGVIFIRFLSLSEQYASIVLKHRTSWDKQLWGKSAFAIPQSSQWGWPSSDVASLAFGVASTFRWDHGTISLSVSLITWKRGHSPGLLEKRPKPVRLDWVIRLVRVLPFHPLFPRLAIITRHSAETGRKVALTFCILKYMLRIERTCSKSTCFPAFFDLLTSLGQKGLIILTEKVG